MRWHFYDPLNAEEAACRANTLRKMDAWWAAFVERSDDLGDLFAGGRQWDLPAWMDEHLRAIDPRLMWEFGPALEGKGHRLVITPEHEHWLRPQVGTLLDRAPELSNWEFYGWRQRETVEQASATVRGRAGGDISQVTAQARVGHSGKIDLLFRSPHCHELGDQSVLPTAFVAAECLLGEQTLERWIGQIEVAPTPKPGLLSGLLRSPKGRDAAESFLPLERLAPTVDALTGHLLEQLPDKPSYAMLNDFHWSTYELQPEKQDDYPHRADLLVAITGRPDVFAAAHGGGLFHSSSVSRCGERFCYIKLDGAEGLRGSQFNDRADIEDALNEVLSRAELGCVIGGGTGLRYSYVDLALVDVFKGVQAASEVLRQGRVPRRTWFLFFDDDWKREWIGVYPDAPPPLFR